MGGYIAAISQFYVCQNHDIVVISLFVHFNRFDEQLGAMFEIPLRKRQILPIIANSPFLPSESPLLPLSGWHQVEVHFACSDSSRKSLVPRYPNSKSHNRLQSTPNQHFPRINGPLLDFSASTLSTRLSKPDRS